MGGVGRRGIGRLGSGRDKLCKMVMETVNLNKIPVGEGGQVWVASDGPPGGGGKRETVEAK